MTTEYIALRKPLSLAKVDLESTGFRIKVAHLPVCAFEEIRYIRFFLQNGNFRQLVTHVP